MENQFNLRDLIYFDFDKAASIFSQIVGGLPKETQSGTETSQDSEKSREFELRTPLINLGRVTGQFGGGYAERVSQLETRVLHHDLLIKVEQQLFENRFAVDLNSEIAPAETNVENVREKLAKISYIRAEGWSAILDYERMVKIASNINKLVDFIRQSTFQNTLEALKTTNEYQEQISQIEEMRTQAGQEKDPNKRNKAIRQIETRQKKFEEQTMKQVEKLSQTVLALRITLAVRKTSAMTPLLPALFHQAIDISLYHAKGYSL